MQDGQESRSTRWVYRVMSVVLAGLVIGLTVTLYLSWRNWTEHPLNRLPSLAELEASASSTRVAPSVAPSRTLVVAPDPSQMETVGSSVPPSTSSTSPAAPTSAVRGEKVVYAVTSSVEAIIQYTSPAGKLWNYTMAAGGWQITAQAGGRITVQSLGILGHIACTTRYSSGIVISGDESDKGAVVCTA